MAFFTQEQFMPFLSYSLISYRLSWLKDSSLSDNLMDRNFDSY